MKRFLRIVSSGVWFCLVSLPVVIGIAWIWIGDDQTRFLNRRAFGLQVEFKLLGTDPGSQQIKEWKLPFKQLDLDKGYSHFRATLCFPKVGKSAFNPYGRNKWIGLGRFGAIGFVLYEVREIGGPDQMVLRISVPVWLVFLISLFLAASLVWFGPARRHFRRIKGLCPSCGYQRQGLVSAQCPECGYHSENRI